MYSQLRVAKVLAIYLKVRYVIQQQIAMCQHLVEQCITKIYSLYSFGKDFCLLIESQCVISSMPKRLSYIIYIQFTLGKTFMHEERKQKN